jgi:hypothetical protein
MVCFDTSLEAAAIECSKTESVDLSMLINEYQKGTQYVDALKAMEKRPVIQVWMNKYSEINIYTSYQTESGQKIVNLL